jgi:hypothetical protein
MLISLLSARNYSVQKQTVSAFFGSLTLRGSQRSALADLPPKPFWELPAIISGGLVVPGLELDASRLC